MPSGTSHNQASPWSSALTLSHWQECNELHFISRLPAKGLPHWGLQLSTSTADFIRQIPHMSAVGARQPTPAEPFDLWPRSEEEGPVVVIAVEQEEVD